MMVKTTTLLFLCTVLVGITTARKATIGVPSDIVGLITEKSVECIAETGADVNILQRIFNWQFDNNKTSKKFSFCLFKKAGFSDDTGHFHKDKILALYEKSDKKEEIKAAVDACDKIAEKNPLETMYKVILCFFDKTPVLLEVKLD
ncbi:PREDICTED: uncharacterized protein LOC106124119 [Papilio xuthus]|uniref:Uncharacterized protein LOC106124119 n=1 Tax=Papilio xuthus TaxID=66420 RepID=A0AAJ7EG12_PAPXU|nr:PREDICTED: uncharacterized protein LOC106124119 [Papilio xuthus]